MANTKLGEFVVTPFGVDEESIKKVRITIKYNTTNEKEISKLKIDIDNFIQDLGKFETLVNGALPFLNIAIAGLISKKQTYPLIHLDFDFKISRLFEYQRNLGKDETTFTLTLETKEDKITKQKKELSPGQIDSMIRNIEKYHSLRETLKLFKESF